MYRFGIVRWAARMSLECWGQNYVGYHLDPEEGPPLAVWYQSARDRDNAMAELANKHIGVLFCPVEVNEGVTIAPGDFTAMTINEKGVMPK